MSENKTSSSGKVKAKANASNGNNNRQTNGNGNHNKKHARLCPGRDIYERMNFLYQASMLMAESVPALSGSYGKLVKSIGKKAVLRIEPAVKRTLCTRCGVALCPIATADFRDFQHKKLSYLEVRCKQCGFEKRYYNNKNHSIRLDDPNSIVETVTFD
ncbi:uncharacterized protein LOC128741383 [Sabethes cyaneus]|uniref:uncharacterized protein LOC128741383 n=1 Tax=Sabethes cyaneus TaxID=53552 RepID=UPI00237DF757|nr:uncharacterized protein LOC128741383 [Sabethes cyaneus]